MPDPSFKYDRYFFVAFARLRFDNGGHHTIGTPPLQLFNSALAVPMQWPYAGPNQNGSYYGSDFGGRVPCAIRPETGFTLTEVDTGPSADNFYGRALEYCLCKGEWPMANPYPTYPYNTYVTYGLIRPTFWTRLQLDNETWRGKIFAIHFNDRGGEFEEDSSNLRRPEFRSRGRKIFGEGNEENKKFYYEDWSWATSFPTLPDSDCKIAVANCQINETVPAGNWWQETIPGVLSLGRRNGNTIQSCSLDTTGGQPDWLTAAVPEYYGVNGWGYALEFGLRYHVTEMFGGNANKLISIVSSTNAVTPFLLLSGQTTIPTEKRLNAMAIVARNDLFGFDNYFLSSWYATRSNETSTAEIPLAGIDSTTKMCKYHPTIVGTLWRRLRRNTGDIIHLQNITSLSADWNSPLSRPWPDEFRYYANLEQNDGFGYFSIWNQYNGSITNPETLEWVRVRRVYVALDSNYNTLHQLNFVGDVYTIIPRPRVTSRYSGQYGEGNVTVEFEIGCAVRDYYSSFGSAVPISWKAFVSSRSDWSGTHIEVNPKFAMQIKNSYGAITTFDIAPTAGQTPGPNGGILYAYTCTSQAFTNGTNYIRILAYPSTETIDTAKEIAAGDWVAIEIAEAEEHLLPKIVLTDGRTNSAYFSGTACGITGGSKLIFYKHTFFGSPQSIKVGDTIKIGEVVGGTLIGETRTIAYVYIGNIANPPAAGYIEVTQPLSERPDGVPFTIAATDKNVWMDDSTKVISEVVEPTPRARMVHIIRPWCSLPVDNKHELLLGVDNPSNRVGGMHVHLNPPDVANFPENLEVITSYVQIPLEQALDPISLAYDEQGTEETITDVSTILWWPVVEDICSTEMPTSVPPRGSIGICYRESTEPAILSLFTIKLTPNALNKIRLRFYHREPGDYRYKYPEIGSFNERIIYISYFPDIQYDADHKYSGYTNGVLDIVRPVGDQIAPSLDAFVSPTVLASKVPAVLNTYSLKVSDYAGVARGDIVTNAVIKNDLLIPMGLYTKPNEIVELCLRNNVIEPTFSSTNPPHTVVQNVPVREVTYRYIYAKYPEKGLLYNYGTVSRMLRWINGAPETATVGVFNQKDVTRFRFYIWDITGLIADPSKYVNLLRTGPFVSGGGITVYSEDIVPNPIFTTTSLTMPGTFEPQRNHLYLWSVNPISPANELANPATGPWSESAQHVPFGIFEYHNETMVAAPITILSPSGAESNLSPTLKVRSLLGEGLYMQYLFKFNSEGMWEPVASGTRPLSLAGTDEMSINLLTGGLLEAGAKYLLLIRWAQTEDVYPPAVISFTARPKFDEPFTELVPVGTIIVNPDESNLLRCAISIASIDISKDIVQTGTVATTRLIGVEKATTAVAVEAGRWLPTDAGNTAITCEIQFNETGVWYPISPLGWNTGAPSILFINTGSDPRVKSQLEARYGTGSVITLEEDVYGLRLRFTLNNELAKLVKYITIRGIG